MDQESGQKGLLSCLLNGLPSPAYVLKGGVQDLEDHVRVQGQCRECVHWCLLGSISAEATIGCGERGILVVSQTDKG